MSLKERLATVFDVFSRRSAQRGPGYKPDEISDRLRQRMLLLYRDVVAGQRNPNPWSPPVNHSTDFWQQMHNALEHLYGRGRLSRNANAQTPIDDALAFVLHCDPAEFFDFIELSFKLDCTWRVMSDENQIVDAVNEIFRIEAAPLSADANRQGERTGHVVVSWWLPAWRDSDSDCRVPEGRKGGGRRDAQRSCVAGVSASARQFDAANLEFRDALDEYRKGHYGDCLTKCGSSFESAMKIVCKRNGWPYDEKKDTAAPLLRIVVSNSTLDPFFEQPLMLIATMRNRLSSSHGGGTEVRSVERHIAQCALTRTAAAIVLLVHEVGG